MPRKDMNNRSVDSAQRNEYRQEGLFELPLETAISDDSSLTTIDDLARDELLVSVLALASVRGIGSRTLHAMFDTGFLWCVWQWDLGEISHHWSLLPGKRRPDLAKLIYDERQKLLETGRKAVEDFHKQEISFVPLGHESYPGTLRRLREPPRWVFVKGNLEAIQSESVIAVVGTREASLEGQKLAYRCAQELVRRNIIVLSGLARGIDEKAHSGAVDCYGQSIAVLGHGISSAYTQIDKTLLSKILDRDGAVISEYFPSEPPSRQRFLRRNELQAAMGRVIIPIECPSMQSGTGATIRRAMGLKTPVVGIIPNNATEKALTATRDNLSRLGHSVYAVFGGNTDELWARLKSILPDHGWDMDPRIRQDRLFSSIEGELLEAKERVSLDGDAVDRFAKRLKQKLQE